MDADRAHQLLVERRRKREAETKREAVAAACAKLRAFYYPKQGAYYTSKAKRRATRKTRRSGATTGGCRELLARALELPAFRATYCNATRIEAKQLAWESDTQGGLVDLLRAIGTRVDHGGTTVYDVAGIHVEVREQDLALEFSNGSRLDLFGADDERALDKLRGRAKHVIWVDEAQKFRFLDKFVKAVATPALADFDTQPGGGELWLTGTPDRDCAGYFYEVTRDDQPGLTGWEVHALTVVDNPFFGDSPEERWERTAGKAIRENAWDENDPDLLREWFARWVKSDARFVYAANAVPEHELCFAPVRLDADGFPDVRAALADLPGRGPDGDDRPYFLAMGADLGTRDDFALVVWAWSLHDPVLYEVCSWKRPGLDYDEMAAFLNAIQAQVYCGILVADAGGGGKPAVMGWSKKWVERYHLPIVEATKTNKPVAIKQLNNDIRHGLCKLRVGSAILQEWRVHRWAVVRSATGKQVEDASTPNHCSDAGLYAHRESYHHRFREEDSTPEHGGAEWIQREEAELEDSADDDSGTPWSW